MVSKKWLEEYRPTEYGKPKDFAFIMSLKNKGLCISLIDKTWSRYLIEYSSKDIETDKMLIKGVIVVNGEEEFEGGIKKALSDLELTVFIKEE
jgi:hypothetical protein